MRVRVAWCVVMRRRSVAISFGNGFGRGQHEPAGLDSLCADQVVGQVSDLASGPAEHDDLEATAGVEVKMRGGHNLLEVVVLQVG